MYSDNTYASDEEDFYDAEEISTASLPEGFRHSKSPLSAAGLLWRNSPNSQSSDEDLSKLEKLQKAEDELIERKKLAEIRLRNEEEEIRQRLEKIERKKQAEVHRQLVLDALAKQREERGKLEQEEEELMALEAETLARENEQRRRKVLMLREKLYSSSSRGHTPNCDNQPCAADGSSLGAPADYVIDNGVVFAKDGLNFDVNGSALTACDNNVDALQNPLQGEMAIAGSNPTVKDLIMDSKPDLQKDEHVKVATSQPDVLPGPIAPPRKKRSAGGSGVSRAGRGASSGIGCSKDADEQSSVANAGAAACTADDSISGNSAGMMAGGVTVPAPSATADKTERISPAQSEHSLNIKLATLGRSYVTTEDQGSKSSEARYSMASQSKRTQAEGDKAAITRMNSEASESAAHNLPEKSDGTNPLSLHIMQLTKDYGRDSISHESDDSQKSTLHVAQKAIKKGGVHLKNLVGKTIGKLKSVADEVLQREDTAAGEDEDRLDGLSQSKKLTSSNHKGHQDFQNVRLVQTFYGEHRGPVWTMKFSPCGRLLATGGQDAIVRVWALVDAYTYFTDMRHKHCESKRSTGAGAGAASMEAHSDEGSTTAATESAHSGAAAAASAVSALSAPDSESPSPRDTPFVSTALARFSGHTSDVLDLSWSKNYFLLSSSMDKTVRLWHMSKSECLCCFQHIDFVTAIVFHPRDERYFLSGSLDGKLRLWNIPEKKVALWNEVAGPIKLITAANFSQNGRFAVVGTYDGRCIFYSTEQFKYFTLINVKSSRGKNARGHKITAIEPLPNEDKILVTSNDSRLRLYDLRDLTLTCKYKGCVNTSSQIKASFSNDGRFIVCGSEDSNIYIWKTYHDFQPFSSARRDRNVYWESIKAHEAVVTATVFAPQPNLFFSRNKSASLKSSGEKSDEGLKLSVEVRCSNSLRSSGGKGGLGTGTRLKAESLQKSGSGERHLGEALVTADYIGTIKVLVKPNEAEKSSDK